MTVKRLPRMARVRQIGVSGVLASLRGRLVPWRIREYETHLARFSGWGLEIGGPSAAFGSRGLLPVYDQARALDNVNYGAETLWEGPITDGGPYRFSASREPGRQYVREGTNLTGLADRSYDFVLSSHTLEHIANPLGALMEWHRVLQPGGTLALVVPEGAKTFDRRRPTTLFEHLVSDYRHDVGEDDETHIEEARRLHDHSRDEAVIIPEVLARPNLTTRAVHHHVFDMPLLINAVECAGYRVIVSDSVWPYHLVILGEAVESQNRRDARAVGVA